MMAAQHSGEELGRATVRSVLDEEILHGSVGRFSVIGLHGRVPGPPLRDFLETVLFQPSLALLLKTRRNLAEIVQGGQGASFPSAHAVAACGAYWRPRLSRSASKASAITSLMIPGSKLTDIWGRKRCLTIGLIVYGIGALLRGIHQREPGLVIMPVGDHADRMALV